MKRKQGVKYCQSTEKQLSDWVEGLSQHNEARDECCPDMSCCRPELRWKKERRVEFVEAQARGDGELVSTMIQDGVHSALHYLNIHDEPRGVTPTPLPPEPQGLR